jgi:hypothetical protein
LDGGSPSATSDSRRKTVFATRWNKVAGETQFLDRAGGSYRRVARGAGISDVLVGVEFGVMRSNTT